MHAPAPAAMVSSAAYDRLAHVIHLYLAVADADRGTQEPHQRQLAIDLSRRWAPAVGPREVEAAVDTAYEAARSGLSPHIERLAGELCRDLPRAACRRLLVDLGLIARADGTLTCHKARVIAQIRAALSAASPDAVA